ncbi:MAG: signal peptidase I [Clostridia bacterium]|nr:signal peptidase I [Clostridia bacterium]
MSARHSKIGFFSKKDRSERSSAGWVSRLYDYIDTLVVAMVLLVLVFTLVVRAAEVKGDSMKPNLYTGDRLILSVHFYEPKYGDIVVINRYTSEPLIKRVIGLPGDRIKIEEGTGKVYRNGNPLSEPYLSGETLPVDLVGEVTVPKDSLFVMGDNRAISKDSRHQEIGMIPQSDVIGKAVFRFWPPRSFGPLYKNLYE